MHVIATAGHVDHGKSTLVRALTGMEPDRWAEERRRGLTIDLGFAWTRLPTGERIAFVDVPGHERFVASMLAGVGPVPAVLLIVAATEGWMPQSAEHLAALDAFGVRDGLLVITKSDLADPEPARAEGLDRLAGTSLAGLPSIAVSAHTGAGLDALRGELAALTKRLAEPAADEDVRLWVDRAFTIKGAGTVVTGTLGGGTLCPGDELTTQTGTPVRIRGLQTLAEDTHQVTPVARVAINLRRVERQTVGRGTALLTPGAWRSTDVVDVQLVRDAPNSGNLVFHLGSAAVATHLRPLGNGFARLTLNKPLPLRVGDRGLLRDPSQRHITGAVILAVRPPALARRGAAQARSMELAAVADAPRRLGTALRLRDRGFAHTTDLRAEGLLPDREPIQDGWYADKAAWESCVEQAAEELAGWIRDHPAATGIPADALRQRLGLPAQELLGGVLESAGLEVSDGLVHRKGAADVLPPATADAVRAIEAELVDAPFQAPSADRLAELGAGHQELAAAVRTGRLVQLAPGVVLRADAIGHAEQILAGLPTPFSVAEARMALDTSRRVAVPLLELLDRRGTTTRLPDGTRTNTQRPKNLGL